MYEEDKIANVPIPNWQTARRLRLANGAAMATSATGAAIDACSDGGQIERRSTAWRLERAAWIGSIDGDDRNDGDGGTSTVAGDEGGFDRRRRCGSAMATCGHRSMATGDGQRSATIDGVNVSRLTVEIDAMVEQRSTVADGWWSTFERRSV